MRRSRGNGARPSLLQRSYCVAILVVAAAFPLFALADGPPEEYRFATGLYKQQRWDLAAEAFRKFLKKYPDHERVPYARLYLGLTLVNADHFADARSVLREYVHNYPRSKSLPDALYRVGECSYLLDDLKSANAELGRFFQQYPQHELVEWALPYLADTKLRLKQPEAARDLFQKTLERFPKSRLTEDSKFGLARAYDELRQTEKASVIYAELAQDKTGSRGAQSLMNLATIEFRADKYADSVKSFLRVVKEFPKSPLVGSAHLNAGFSLYRMGRFPQAIEEFDRAASDKRQNLAAGYWKGISLKALGDYAKAVETLKAVFDANPKGALAESALFYRADCEMRSGHFDAAKALFLELVQKWPKGEFADDSLHFAAESALLAGSTDESEQLVLRFEKEYRDSPLALHEEILLGRVLNAKAAVLAKQGVGNEAEKNRQAAGNIRRTAVEHLEKVVAKSQLPRTLDLARYHLGRAVQDAGEHARAVEALAPLVEQADRPDASAEAVEAVAFSGHSLDELGKYEAAVAALSKYLSKRPNGAQAERALADRAYSNAMLAHKAAAVADVKQLLEQFPKGSAGPETLRRIAELSYEAHDWKTAEDLFGKMAELGPTDAEVRRTGLSGLGWTRFERKAYEESAAAFGQVFERFSIKNPQVAEAGFMRGRALQEGNKLPEAAKAYAAAFQKLAPPSPSGPDDEARGSIRYGFLSGVQAAAVLSQLKRYDEADAAYRLVVDRFPKAQKLGEVLLDWANVLYLAKKDDANQRHRVREVLERIVRDFPENTTGDNARLFLAELDLLDGKANAAEKEIRDLLANPKIDAKVREDGTVRWIGLAVDNEDWATVRDQATKFLAAFPDSADARLIRLHLAAAQLGLKDPAAAEKTLSVLKQELNTAKGDAPDWAARAWVLLAEAYHRQKKYTGVVATVDELRHRMPKSEFLYQADEILGRSFKNQAEWEKAVAAFQRVIDARPGEQNATAAKSQLMIAEIRFLQKDYRAAKENYLKVCTLYDKLPDWAAPALFQVGQCEEELKQLKDAEKTYTNLVANFPPSEYTEKAKKRLDTLHQRPKG